MVSHETCLFSLLDQAVAVGIEELLELFNLILEDETLVGISDKDAIGGVGFYDRGAGDIFHVLDGLTRGAEGFVLDQMKSLRIEDERVACYTSA